MVGKIKARRQRAQRHCPVAVEGWKREMGCGSSVFGWMEGMMEIRLFC